MHKLQIALSAYLSQLMKHIYKKDVALVQAYQTVITVQASEEKYILQ
jgi:hypothetical protein